MFSSLTSWCADTFVFVFFTISTIAGLFCNLELSNSNSINTLLSLLPNVASRIAQFSKIL